MSSTSPHTCFPAGIFFYSQSQRCRGLRSTGQGPVSTEVKADSYAKVIGHKPVLAANYF
jgi:hypothetical protein